MSSASQLVGKINDAIIDPIIGLLMILALFLFAWGLFRFIANPDNDEERTKGKRHMIWAIIGLFLMFSVVGILRIVLNTFEVPTDKRPEQLK